MPRIDELPLIAAIYRVRLALMADGEELRSQEWVYDRSIELCKMIAEELVTERIDEYLRAFERYGKQSKSNDMGERKSDIIAQLFINGMNGCFYAGRGIGECSEDIDLDRIRAGGDYTMANCVLSCSYHNRSRSNKDIADYCNQSAK